MIVLVAMLLAVVFTAAALSVDIASQVNEKQELYDTLDAAVHAGAFELPGAGAATLASVQASMEQSLEENDPSLDQAAVDAIIASAQYFCVTASQWSGSAWVPAPYTDGICSTPSAVGRVCNEQLCSTPCTIDTNNPNVKCNTVRIGGNKDVDYNFAPVIGQDEGSTGALSSAACRGPCGEMGSPLDIALVLDRTGSMRDGSTNHVETVRDAVNGTASTQGMLDLLEPDRHRVAIGTIHKAFGDVTAHGASAVNCRSTTSANSGSWVPVGLTNQFQMSPAQRSMVRSLLPQAIQAFGRVPAEHEIPEPYRSQIRDLSGARLCVEVLPYALSSIGGQQTDFQGPMLGAAAELQNAPARPDGIPARQAIIFMTDGEPNLPPGQGCRAGDAAATQAKDAGIIVVTIAYRIGANIKCGEAAPYDSTMKATELLSRMATQQGEGAGVDRCNDGNPGLENNDGDFFFCAPNPQDLLPVFQAALAAISENITLLRLPN